MRRTLALFLSFSLGAPPLFAYDDYSDRSRNNYGVGSSVNQFQQDWSTRNNWARSYNDNASIILRPPACPPSYDFDLSFSHAFSPSLNFNSIPKLSNNTFAVPEFAAKPVIQNVNFQANSFQSGNLSFNPPGNNNTLDSGRLSAQTFRQDSFSSNQELRSQEFRLPDTFSRSPSSDFNSRSLQPSPLFRSPVSDLFRTAFTASATLPTLAPAAASAVRSALGSLFPLSPKSFSAAKPAQPTAAMQTRAQTSLFDGVAAKVKAIPAFIAAVGSKIKDAAVAVWNRVVLGHRTEATATLPDGSTLSGKITVNRKDEVLSVAPGAVRTVGHREVTPEGQSLLLPSKEPVNIQGEDYLQGAFVFDGKGYNLEGPGLKLTTQAGPTIEGTQKVKAYVQGDGKGNETTLGYGALSQRDTFRETTTGFSFRNMNGVWGFNPSQSGTLKLDGKAIPIAIDEGGHFDRPVSMTTQKPAQTLVTGILPNPETSGYQVLGVVKLAEGESFKAGIPGTKPSQYLSGQLNDWRQQVSAHVRTEGLMSNTETEAKVHQEGDQYVFTGGHAAFAAVTGPNESRTGQDTLYTEAVFSQGTKLTVTGPTEFPNYGTTVFAGNVAIQAEGRMDIGKGTLYDSKEQGLRFTISLDGRETAIPVKSLDLKAGTFVAVIADVHQEKSGGYVATQGREVQGRIDFNNGRAALVDTAIEAPLLTPRRVLGTNTSDIAIGVGRLTIRDNDIKVLWDKSGAGLDNFRTLDPRPTREQPVHQAYQTLVDTYTDPTNPGWARSTAAAVSVFMGPALLVEGAYDFSADFPAAWRDTVHQAALVTIDLKAGKKIDAALNALVGVYYTADFLVRVIPAGEFASQTGKMLAVEASGLTQSARSLAGRVAAELEGFAKPVLNEFGYLSLANKPSAPKTLLERQQGLLTGDPGVNITPRSVAVEYGTVGKGGRTFVTDIKTVEDVVGPLRGDRIRITPTQAKQLEHDLGLNMNSLERRNIIYIVDDISRRAPASPLRGNTLFQGGGKGLPGGGPEVTVTGINSAGGSGVRRQIVLEVE